MPATKFSKMSLKASPTAIEPMPRPARRLPGVSVGKTIVAEISMPTTQTVIATSLPKASTSAGRSRVRPIALVRKTTANFAMTAVRTMKTIAITSCGKSSRKPLHSSNSRATMTFMGSTRTPVGADGVRDRIRPVRAKSAAADRPTGRGSRTAARRKVAARRHPGQRAAPGFSGLRLLRYRAPSATHGCDPGSV